jgi:GntR family transcriptional regulator/MocR family aminotransferase
MREVYRVRREMVIETLTRQFGDCLKVVPSIAGLHIAAFARTASSQEIRAIVQKAVESEVAVQELSVLAHSELSGLMLGYGAIPTANIREGLRRLRGCFSAHRAGISVA